MGRDRAAVAGEPLGRVARALSVGRSWAIMLPLQF